MRMYPRRVTTRGPDIYTEEELHWMRVYIVHTEIWFGRITPDDTERMVRALMSVSAREASDVIRDVKKVARVRLWPPSDVRAYASKLFPMVIAR